MKKLFAILAAVLTAAVMMSMTACVEEGAAETADQEAYAYAGSWLSDDGTAMAEISAENGGFRVLVTKSISWPDALAWEYSCTYDKAAWSLVSGPAGNTKQRITYSDDLSSRPVETYYEDGTATFTIREDGRLIWKDAKEDAGNGIVFRSLGIWLGNGWTGGGKTLDFGWEKGAYTARFTFPDGKELSALLRYDAADGGLKGEGNARILYNSEEGSLTCSGIDGLEDGTVFLPVFSYEQPEDRYDNSTWTCDRVNVDIFRAGDLYTVLIHWGSSATESVQWFYICEYDEETDSLSCSGKGVKSELAATDENEPDAIYSTDLYTDGSATFYVNENGNLIWNDLTEGAGDGMEFEPAVG
ncbi:MAG: hypothetical protein IKH18_10860 [Clostridia bacterium]|nr:hypothetical protein [Clostridia bacterium]